jgi:hypothetical protein
MTGAPLVFFRASLYNEEHNLRQGCVSCPENLRGVGNDFSITGSDYMDTAPTFSKKVGVFVSPANAKRYREEAISSSLQAKNTAGLTFLPQSDSFA